jgi:hypothetical protein
MEETNIVVPEPIYQKVQLDSQTKAVCTVCGREDAPTLFFRRHKGLYSLLCFMPDGSGCYSNSAKVLCQYVDSDLCSCTQLAEHEIIGGVDGLTIQMSCNDHLGRFVGQQSVYRIHPLD